MRAVAAILALIAFQEAPPRVTAEFRVFAGTEEITTTTRLRVMTTGSRDHSATVEEGKRLIIDVPPGIYDVQALRLRPEGIVAIRWAERLVMMHYPDEGGRHLEVINFKPGYGALQLRATRGAVDAYDVTIFPGYRLFVLAAGRYDIRVRHAGTQIDAADTHWFLDVEVPPDRTRLKLIDVDG
jgi:hypothetical protein